MAYYSWSLPLLCTGGAEAVCGAEGIRTPDLISAIDALSQLSYSPMCISKYMRIEQAVKFAQHLATVGTRIQRPAY